jgi:hypothetical protein
MDDAPKLPIPPEVQEAMLNLSRPAAVKFLPDGEAIIWRKGGKHMIQPLSMDIPAEDPVMSSGAHLIIRAIYEMVRQIRGLKRAVPLLRGELFSQMPNVLDKSESEYKALLRELEKKGMVTAKSVPIVKNGTKAVEVRSLVLLTSLGRGYVKKYIDPEYTLEGIDYGAVEKPKDGSGGVERSDNVETVPDSGAVQPSIH